MSTVTRPTSRNRTKEEIESLVTGISRIQGVDQRVPKKPCGVEKETQLWKEESCGNRVRHDESEVHRESEFKAIQGTEKRAFDQGGPSQHRTVELLGV